MRTRCRARIDTQPLLSVQEEEEQEATEVAAAADGAMWEEHLQAMWGDMSKQELEEEVTWRRDDQKSLAERITYLQAELKRKDEELTKKRTMSSRRRRMMCCASTRSLTGKGHT